MSTPSKRRRMGREAYIRGEDPVHWLPWKQGSWGFGMYASDFVEGWKEAEEAARVCDRPKPNEEDEHPVRFTVSEVEFIKHMIIESGYDLWEEESVSLTKTIDQSEYWL